MLLRGLAPEHGGEGSAAFAKLLATVAKVESVDADELVKALQREGVGDVQGARLAAEVAVSTYHLRHAERLVLEAREAGANDDEIAELQVRCDDWEEALERDQAEAAAYAIGRRVDEAPVAAAAAAAAAATKAATAKGKRKKAAAAAQEEAKSERKQKRKRQRKNKPAASSAQQKQKGKRGKMEEEEEEVKRRPVTDPRAVAAGRAVLADVSGESLTVDAERQRVVEEGAKAGDELCRLMFVILRKWLKKGDAWATLAAIEALGDAGDDLAYSCAALIRWQGTGHIRPPDPKTALKLYLKAARRGCHVAEYNVGLCYSCGWRGQAADDAEAAKWYKRSAAQGNTGALVDLGLAYERGTGVERSSRRAASCFARAAAENDARGLVLYGKCLDRGRGADKDAEAAADHYRRSAELGHWMGQYMLGRCYLKGNGVRRSKSLAEQWLRLAAAQDEYPEAAYYLGTILADKEETLDEGVHWFRVAARGGIEAAEAELELILG